MTYSPPPVIFGQPYFDEDEATLLLSTLRSGWIGQGPLVSDFERRLAEYTGAPHVVAVSSCTAALHLSLVGMGVGPGDEVITTAMTFVATVNAIEHAGATPVLVDIDPETLNISLDAVLEAITPRTRAVVPVHFGGRAVDTLAIDALAQEHDLFVVEDAAHALGGVVRGRRVGGHARERVATCYSFYPNKNLASAEGGAIALADPHLASRLRSLRLHGLEEDAWGRYRSQVYRPSMATYPGFKANFTDLQASIALGQLDKLEGFLAAREHLADIYDERLADVAGVELVPRGEPSLEWRHALHLYQVRITGGAPRRDAVLDKMRADQIGAAVHYVPVHRHPYYAGRLDAVLPVTDEVADSLLTLPLHLHMSRSTVLRVVGSLRRAMAET
ncbi:DegT/DnrJ/EryC1/StrS family aminotransferase [Quadrisphaera oryzae]|uniref:DegT/DnrJ/EryC1/StrS family aminotransferase n=1 Tax=Quadrisphaera TaxID=317661 RepID=UPI001647DDFD|nr:DegT/DnrJ/EryC1/StrS family aminotransferase [Quadrisphaera sp. RL12-1S]